VDRSRRHAHRWERDEKTRKVISRWSKLVRVRALPNATTEAWTLVLPELVAPDFLIADGAAAIEKAATAVWGTRTTFVPCMYYALANITAKLMPTKGNLRDKVRDHLYGLSRDDMATGGLAAVTHWFDTLATVADAAGLTGDMVAAQGSRREPLIRRTAAVALADNDPEVQVSNSAVEAHITQWVKQMTRRRGAAA
jgi:hypothetical protein